MRGSPDPESYRRRFISTVSVWWRDCEPHIRSSDENALGGLVLKDEVVVIRDRRLYTRIVLRVIGHHENGRDKRRVRRGYGGCWKGFVIPRYGSERGPAGVVMATCVLKGEMSTKRLLFSMPTCCESKKIPNPPRRLVFPSPWGSNAKPTRGEKLP